MTECERLRHLAQSLESRHRLALAALDALQRRMLALNLPLEPASMLLAHIEGLRQILRGEVRS
jgi:hypothetical protein